MVLKLEQLSAISSGAKKEPCAIFEIRHTGNQWCIFLNGTPLPGQCFTNQGEAAIVAQMIAYGTRQMSQGTSLEDTMADIAGMIFDTPKANKRRRK